MRPLISPNLNCWSSRWRNDKNKIRIKYIHIYIEKNKRKFLSRLDLNFELINRITGYACNAIEMNQPFLRSEFPAAIKILIIVRRKRRRQSNARLALTSTATRPRAQVWIYPSPSIRRFRPNAFAHRVYTSAVLRWIHSRIDSSPAKNVPVSTEHTPQSLWIICGFWRIFRAHLRSLVTFRLWW